MISPFASVDALFETLEDVRPGDVVTAREHHLQTAALLARDFPDDLELQVAGLVHDIASSLSPRPPGDHAAVGAALVEPLLGARVARIVGGHVFAKRWLVGAHAGYRALLSANSTATLAAQGDALDDVARARFEAAPDFRACIAVRRADDAAKVPGAAVLPLSAWRAVVDEVACAAHGHRISRP